MNTNTHGFELVDERTLDEIGTLARRYRHRKSGAELLSLINDDDNKVFGIAFATPSDDSTGIAHVMEHSVLCGSRKYPLKEPFVELIKASLNTFVNAMTWPDHTVYPVASQNQKDLYNLVDVYLDAVFYPKLTRWTLMQEGWHYELQSMSDPLVYKGVVFNEMKGNYSSPDSVLAEYVRQSLFPDTIYGHDAGGDPEFIPDLSYERFKRFHATYYHPSNARIVFSGNDDPDLRLRYLDSWLRDFDAAAVEPELPLQPRWPAPRRVTKAYDPGEDTDAALAYVSVNWLLGECTDPETALALEILSHILAGTPASPLRKRLIDSGLGEDVTGGYVDSDCRESYFPIGLKGVRPADVDVVEALILDTVTELAESGFDPTQVEASLNTTEFNLREANFGGFPRGIVYMIQALQTWLYGGDPLSHLAFAQPLDALKKALARGEDPFLRVLRERLALNVHRSTVILLPDASWLARRDEAEAHRLESARARMTPEELERLVDETATLARMQVTPDSPEALASVPALDPRDLDRAIRAIPAELDVHPDATVLWHGLNTRGIVYLDVAFDMHALPARYVPYMGLFGSVLLEMGTESLDFVQLTQRIGCKTGGIGATAINTVRWGNRAGVSQFVLRGKCTTPRHGDLLGILIDVLLDARLDDRDRFRQIVLEERADVESDIVPHGNAFAGQRLRAGMNSADWVSEQTGGVSYLFFLRRLLERIDADWQGVLGDLEDLRASLINRAAMTVNITVDEADRSMLAEPVRQFISALPESSPSQGFDWPDVSSPGNEGLCVPSQVNFVAKGADLYALGHRLSGSWLVVQNWLSTSYLWERVRVRGGAYGGSCRLDPLSGIFVFSSYRDPNLAETVEIYDGTAAFLRSQLPDPSDVKRSIIGVIGGLDRYQLPDAKGYTAFIHHLSGMTDDVRQTIRDEVLQTGVDDFLRFADVLDDVSRSGAVVALGSAGAIQRANSVRGHEWLSMTRVL